MFQCHPIADGKVLSNIDLIAPNCNKYNQILVKIDQASGKAYCGHYDCYYQAGRMSNES
ncbi:MAG: hypothetical protein ACRY3E_05930 [Candidatus Lariskella arthropodorum]